jgi:hypothetical protein
VIAKFSDAISLDPIFCHQLDKKHPDDPDSTVPGALSSFGLDDGRERKMMQYRSWTTTNVGQGFLPFNWAAPKR